MGDYCHFCGVKCVRENRRRDGDFRWRSHIAKLDIHFTIQYNTIQYNTIQYNIIVSLELSSAVVPGISQCIVSFRIHIT